MRRLIAVLVLLAGVASAQIGIQVQNNGTPIATPSNTTWWGGAFKINFVNGGCSWNNSSKRMDCTFAGVTNSGTLTLNHLALGGGAAVVKVDSACVTDGAGALLGCTSVSTGTAPAGIGASATGGFGSTEASSTGWTPTANTDYCRADSTTHMFLCSFNGSAEQGFIAPYPVAGTSITMAVSGLYKCSGACNVTFAAIPGNQYCVRNADNISSAITLVNVASVQFEATARTSYYTANHKLVSGGAVTDQACYVVASDGTHFDHWSSTGTWTDTP